jgi:hypothetical protein
MSDPLIGDPGPGAHGTAPPGMFERAGDRGTDGDHAARAGDGVRGRARKVLGLRERQGRRSSRRLCSRMYSEPWVKSTLLAQEDWRQANANP